MSDTIESKQLSPKNVIPQIEIDGSDNMEEKDKEEEEEEYSVSPVASPREFIVSTPREQNFTEENLVSDYDEQLEGDELWGEDSNGKKVLRAAPLERIIKWIAFESNSKLE